MNIFVLLGILLVAIGTGVMVYGSHRAMEASQETTTRQVESRIDDALIRMDEIASTGDPGVQSALLKVESDFSEWASDFLSSRTDREVEVGRARLESRASDLELSRELAPYYRSFLRDLSDRIDALNARTDLNVKYDIGPLNDDFLSQEYTGTVRFSDSVEWKLRIGRQSLDDTPSIAITKEHGNALSRFSAVVIGRLTSSRDSADVTLVGKGFEFPMLPEAVDLTDVAFRDFARRLLEGELHRLGL